MDAFVGEIRAFGFDYPPMGWLDCDGTVYPMNQYPALGALLGRNYGGDGVNNFGVPDMRVLTPFGAGVSDFGTLFSDHTYYGRMQTTLSAANVPMHSHTATFIPTNPTTLSVSIKVADAAATAPSPQDNLLAKSVGMNTYATAATPPAKLAGTTASLSGEGAVTVAVAGAAAPVPVVTRPSIVAMRLCICVEGLFPTQP